MKQKCQSCGIKVRFPPSLSGETVNCPQCSKPIILRLSLSEVKKLNQQKKEQSALAALLKKDAVSGNKSDQNSKIKLGNMNCKKISVKQKNHNQADKTKSSKKESHRETVAKITAENHAYFLEKYGEHHFKPPTRARRLFMGGQSVQRDGRKWSELTRVINENASALAIKRRQLIFSGSYGEEKIEDWEKEMEYFIKIKGLEKIAATYSDAPPLKQLIDEIAKSTQVKKVSPTSHPIEFERQCAETLQHIGWSTQLTAKTGDQGIDIIAKKDGIKIVVQCKLYANPVGNGAVQEIAAGRSFERADHAVVVTTSGFTKSARTLAKNTEVLLLDFAELAELDSRLSI